MSQKLLKPAVVPQGITMKPVFNGVLFFKKIKIELCSDGIKGDVGLLNTPKVLTLSKSLKDVPFIMLLFRLSKKI